jgi:hypothetical protein
MQDTDPLLTVREVSDLLRVVPLTLARWRNDKESGNRGPDYVRVGQRILYRRSVVYAWLKARDSYTTSKVSA